VLLLACSGTPGGTACTAAVAAPLELVETFPVETSLDHPDLPEADTVWIEMIESARESLDFAEFYASNRPGSRLEAVVRAVEAAAERGVHVRFLAGERFYATYPETLERLAARDGITMRRYDVASLMGGVLHAKYFLVDGRELYVGSQNFDWRALEHIQELGVRVRVASIVAAFADVFETDWALAGGADPATRVVRHAAGATFPVRVVMPAAAGDGAGAADTLAVTPVFSPRDWLPDPSLWDLPRLIELIHGARSTLDVQLLGYRTVGRDGTYWDQIESALRRAAARGVQVRLLLADWSKRPGTIEGLQSLQVLPGIEVRLLSIPAWSGGFIPFARVAHAKYMVVDAARAWIGTSNWERGYFHESRNAGLIIEAAGAGEATGEAAGGRAGAPAAGSLPARLQAYFVSGWQSPYAAPVDACAEYAVPRIGP
jgi:phosphatidylserine/phosphatidylglycerophosphate/cardiolipin synthase-like enzyme